MDVLDSKLSGTHTASQSHLRLGATISSLLILHVLASRRGLSPAESSLNVSVLASLFATNTAVH